MRRLTATRDTAALMQTARTLLRDESGQDVVEYALLAALVGVAGVLVWQQVVTAVGTGYLASDAAVQGASACTPDPGGGGCP